MIEKPKQENWAWDNSTTNSKPKENVNVVQKKEDLIDLTTLLTSPPVQTQPIKEQTPTNLNFVNQMQNQPIMSPTYQTQHNQMYQQPMYQQNYQPQFYPQSPNAYNMQYQQMNQNGMYNANPNPQNTPYFSSNQSNQNNQFQGQPQPLKVMNSLGGSAHNGNSNSGKNSDKKNDNNSKPSKDDVQYKNYTNFESSLINLSDLKDEKKVEEKANPVTISHGGFDPSLMSLAREFDNVGLGGPGLVYGGGQMGHPF